MCFIKLHFDAACQIDQLHFRKQTNKQKPEGSSSLARVIATNHGTFLWEQCGRGKRWTKRLHLLNTFSSGELVLHMRSPHYTAVFTEFSKKYDILSLYVTCYRISSVNSARKLMIVDTQCAKTMIPREDGLYWQSVALSSSLHWLTKLGRAHVTSFEGKGLEMYLIRGIDRTRCQVIISTHIAFHRHLGMKKRLMEKVQCVWSPLSSLKYDLRLVLPDKVSQGFSNKSIGPVYNNDECSVQKSSCSKFTLIHTRLRKWCLD